MEGGLNRLIQVFSKRRDKPHQYEFTDLSQGTDIHAVGFKPIEVAISADGKKWNSMYDAPDLDNVLVADSPYVAPAKQTDEYQKLGVNDGEELLSSSYTQREIKILVVFNGMNQNDVVLAFDALQRFFVSRTPYWICFDNWPQRMYYVKVSDVSQSHLTDHGFAVEITFMDQIGLSRSIGSTAEWSTEALMGFGNNEPIKRSLFTFNSNSFVIHNPSDVMIDPERRGHPFKLVLNGSSSGKMKITNQTTGASISREKDFSGTWELDGVNPILNGKGDLLNTDMGTINLQIGDNQFQIDNFSGTVKFDFPVWWLS